jgi:hypothetical protein
MTPLGRSRRVLNNSIKMDLKDMVWEEVKDVDLAERTEEWWAVLNTAMRFWFP